MESAVIISKSLVLAGAAGASLSIALACAASGAGNPVAQRQATMKHVGESMKEASGFVTGKTAWDPAKVKAVMAGIAADAKTLKGLYPPGSDKDPKSEALPKIWQDKADFEKHLAAMGEAATAAGNAADAAAFRPAYMKLGGTCKSCHDVYRKAQP